MKKVIIKQVFPLLLIMLLLFELMPINTITAGEESNEPMGAIVDTIKKPIGISYCQSGIKGTMVWRSAVTVVHWFFGTEYKQTKMYCLKSIRS